MFQKIFNIKLMRSAIPFIIANASIPLIGVMNIAIAGHLDSSDYIDALSIGSMIVGILFWWLSSLRMGTTGLVAQAVGQKDAVRLNHVLQNSILLALIVSLFVWVFSDPILKIA